MLTNEQAQWPRKELMAEGGIVEAKPGASTVTKNLIDTMYRWNKVGYEGTRSYTAATGRPLGF